MFENWVNFEKKMGCSKNNLNPSKILKGGKFAVECLPNGITPLKYYFAPQLCGCLSKKAENVVLGNS